MRTRAPDALAAAPRPVPTFGGSSLCPSACHLLLSRFRLATCPLSTPACAALPLRTAKLVLLLRAATQSVRWLNTKEDHANSIISTAADYMLAQRVKKELFADEAEYKEVRGARARVHSSPRGPHLTCQGGAAC